MKNIFALFFVLIFSMVLSSCINNKEEKTKSIANNKEYNSVFINSNDNFLKHAIEKRKQEEEKKKEEIWRSQHLLATASTVFNPNKVERTNNIKLASNFINGLVLNPGETFSFNGTVGQRTLERGFLPADVYFVINGEVVSKLSPGGGICQVSSTLCMAVMQTNMNIIERNVHSKEVEYATPEYEAMINWGTSDFRFVNNYDFPVKLEILFVQSKDNEQIICNIFSL